MIETERLVLRMPRPDDDIAEFMADEEVQRWTGGTGEPAQEVLDRWLRRWDANGIGQFIVELDGTFVGRVGFLVWDSRTWETSTYALAGEHAETELGWAILTTRRGRGYASEAALVLRDWAIAERGLTRVISLIHPENLRSIRVAEKIGESYEQDVMVDGVPTLLYSLTA